MPDDPITPPGDPVEPDDPPADPVGAAIAAPTLSPDAIRNTPEYRVLARQNRELARQAGAARREADEARRRAEEARQAAEAQQQADLEAELSATLGDEGVALYNEIAELSQSDPVAAARKIAAALAQARGQTPPAAAPTEPPAAPAAPEGGSQVPQTPPPPAGLGASVALSQAPRNPEDEYTAIADELDRQFQDVAARVQDPATRARTTMRDRAGGMISYLAGQLIRAGARPSK